MTTTLRTPTDAERRDMERRKHEYDMEQALKNAKNTLLRVHPDLLAKSDVAALVFKVEPHVEHVRGIPLRLQKLVEDQALAVRAAKLDRNLSDEGRISKEKAIRQRTKEQIAAIQAELQESEERVNAALSRVMEKPEPDVQTQILAELKGNRIVQRVQQQLSAVAGDPGKFQAMVQRLAEATPEGDLTALASVIREQTEGSNLSPMAGSVLDQYVTPRIEASLPPVEQAGRQIERECQSGFGRVAASVAAMNNLGRIPIVGIAGFNEGEFIPFASGS